MAKPRGPECFLAVGDLLVGAKGEQVRVAEIRYGHRRQFEADSVPFDWYVSAPLDLGDVHVRVEGATEWRILSAFPDTRIARRQRMIRGLPAAEYYREYRRTHAARCREHTNKWAERNREKRREYMREYDRRRREV